MTGYTVHTGSNEKFSAGWDQIFSGQAQPAKKGAAATGKKGKKGASAAASGKRGTKKEKRGK
ncbi:MAG: hypothetical protein JSS49_10290 [Planctomycetes bacterium]|nr:hypothetical protein [Planctomycetota bacterium]